MRTTRRLAPELAHVALGLHLLIPLFAIRETAPSELPTVISL